MGIFINISSKQYSISKDAFYKNWDEKELIIRDKLQLFAWLTQQFLLDKINFKEKKKWA